MKTVLFKSKRRSSRYFSLLTLYVINRARVKALGLHRSAQQNERNDSVIFSTQSSNLEIIMTESDGELEWVRRFHAYAISV